MLLFANVNHHNHHQQQQWNSQNSILNLLKRCKTTTETNQIQAGMVKTGLINNSTLTTKIILSLSASRQPPLTALARTLFFFRHAFQVFDTDVDDPFLWNAVIKTYSHGEDPKQGLRVFRLMLENGVVVDEFTLSLVLKACSRVGFLKFGMMVHGFLKKIWFGPDLFLQNCLILLYLRCGCLGYARRVFDMMKRRDSVSYNSMIDGYVKCGDVGPGKEVFDSMPEEDRNVISWNSMLFGLLQLEDGIVNAWEHFDKMPHRDLVSWNSMIDGCVKCGRMGDARALFDAMPNRDVVTWANMIDGYAKMGRIDIARSLFDDMRKTDVVVCNALMGGYVRNGSCSDALDMFFRMQSDDNLSPDKTTFLIALSAVAQLGQVDKGIAIHRYLEEKSISLDGKLGVALIDMYSKCGSIHDATLVFKEVNEKTVDHWNAMIGGLANHGLGELALNLFIEMERMSMKPDDITYIGLLNACGHSGLVKEGMMCFDIMRRAHKIVPKLQHYGCMVDIMSRAGRVEDAKSFVEQMPIEPNEVIWRTLLGACTTHESRDIGESAAEHLIKKDYSNSSSYVLLSNIYSSLHLWNQARTVRTTMKELNLKKLPGRSWIELEGHVHEFLVQDKSHPHVTDVYSLLNSMSMPNSGLVTA